MRYAVSALAAGLVAGSGAGIAALTQLEPGEAPSVIGLLVAVLTGVAAAAKDVSARMAEPPQRHKSDQGRV